MVRTAVCCWVRLWIRDHVQDLQARRATDRWKSLVRQRSGMTGDTVEQIMQASAARVPVGRIGQPEDIANMVVFLTMMITPKFFGIAKKAVKHSHG